MSKHLCTTLLFVFALGACSEIAHNPVTIASPDGPRYSTSEETTTVEDLDAEFGHRWSFDPSEEGLSASFYFDDGGDGERPAFCRDHFRQINLWWDGGSGNMVFVLDPPQLFRSYTPGSYRDRRRLVWRKAVFESLQASEATDPAGNLWRFRGKYNALCRGGDLEIGPIVFRGQLVVAQDPIDRPILVRSACGGAGGSDPFAFVADPNYDPYSSGGDGGGCGHGGGDSGSGTQYQPGDFTGGETVDWGTGVGNGGTSVCGSAAVVEYVCIDVWVDGVGWVEWGCGYVTTC